MGRVGVLVLVLLLALSSLPYGNGLEYTVYPNLFVDDVACSFNDPCTVPLVVPDPGIVSDVDVTVDFTGDSHTFMGDLIVVIVTPSNAFSILTDDSCGSTDWTGAITFDDAGIDPLCSTTFPRTVPPATALSDLNGLFVTGTWNLGVIDQYGGDDGTLSQVTLDVEVEDSGFDNSIYDQDLTSWSILGDPSAFWIFTGNGVQNTGTQTTNNDLPAYLMTPSGSNTVLKGRITVVGSDDDWIGIAFASGTEAIVLSWKQADQVVMCDGEDVNLPEGMKLIHTSQFALNNVASCSNFYLDNTGPVTIIASAQTLSTTGWETNVEYEIIAAFSDNRITIWVDEVLQFDYSIDQYAFGSELPIELVGVYGLSQANVVYSDLQLFESRGLEDCTAIDLRLYFVAAIDEVVIVVDYGDGTTDTLPLDTQNTDAGRYYVDLTHTYLNAGSYLISATLTENGVPLETENFAAVVDPRAGDVNLVAGYLCGSIEASSTPQVTYFYWDDLEDTTTATRFNLRPGTYTAYAVDTCLSLPDSYTIVDTPPTARCASSLTYDIGVTGYVELDSDELNNGSSDPCSMLTLTLDNDAFVSGDCSALGSQTSRLIASGYRYFSTSSCETTVQIVDTVAPVAICRNLDLALPEEGDIQLSVGDIDAGSYDVCSIAESSISQSRFSEEGVYTVTLTVTDQSGNRATCSSEVNVYDLESSSGSRIQIATLVILSVVSALLVLLF